MYQPRIRDDLILRLYRLGKALNVPMTKLASMLLEPGIQHLEYALTRMGYVLQEDTSHNGKSQANGKSPSTMKRSRYGSTHDPK